MRTPSPAALLDRARSLLVHMHGVERWAYALDIGVRARLEKAAEEAAYALVERDEEGKVCRYEAIGPDGVDSTLVALERSDLGLILVQAYGPGTPDRLRKVIESTGFVPQSQLLRHAYDLAGAEEASKALTALAHMVVAWDEDWTDLFLLHLASPDPVARHTACLATVVAALCAGAREPALTLLQEARSRERFPQLGETLAQAISTVETLPARSG